MPEQSGDSFDFCVLFRVYFTGKGASVISYFEIAKFPGLLLTNYEQKFVRNAACISNVERAIIGSWQVSFGHSALPTNNTKERL